MPQRPFLPSLSAHMAEAIANSSSIQLSDSQLNFITPEPIQPLREIRGSGYDAIVQVTDELMLDALKHSLPNSRAVDAPIPLDLEPALINEVTDRVAAERVEAEVIAYPIRPERVVVDLRPSGLRAELSLSGIEVSHDIDPTILIRCRVELSVLATETTASYEARVDRSSFDRAPPPFRGRIPAGSDPVSTLVSLDSVQLTIEAPVATQVDVDRFQLDALFDFSAAELREAASSPWGPTALDLAAPLIRAWGQSEIAPSIRMFGNPTPASVPDISRFDVTVVGMPSNRLGTLLSFCLEVGPGTSAPQPDLVGAFTGGGNFAFYATSPVIRATVLSRWRSLPRRDMEWTVPMAIERDGVRREASARVRFEIGEAHWAGLSYGSEYMSDNILLRADFTSQALSARLNGEDITAELGDLATPQLRRELFRLFPDHSPVQQTVESVDDWLLSVGRHVLPPLHRPVELPWRLRGDFHTQVSTPLSAMLTRGVLL